MLLQLATWLSALAAAACWGASFLPPEAGRAWAALSIVSPVALIVNLFWVVVWLLGRQWRTALIPLAALLLNVRYITASVQLFAPHDTPPATLRIATLNTFYFNYNGADFHTETTREVMHLAVDNEVDILCLQEFGSCGRFKRDSIRRTLRVRMPHVVEKNSKFFASRFPIIRHRYSTFEESEKGYLWADLKVGDDTLRVISVHLQTTGVSALRSTFRNEYHREAPVEKLLVSVERNSRIRATQIDELRAIIDTTHYPLLLVGDFNDTPSSYAYRKINRVMEDGFREAGCGFGSTFRPLGGVLRIDYIFSRGGLRCTSYRTLREAVSDHKMVMADFALLSQL